MGLCPGVRLDPASAWPVLGRNAQPSKVPYRAICCRAEAEFGDMGTVGIVGLQHADETARQVLIEQQPHAGVARRRSRSAANSMAARTCFSLNSGKSPTICEGVIPEAK